MRNNAKIILINFDCKNFSFEKAMVLHRTTAQPCWIGQSFVAYMRLQLQKYLAPKLFVRITSNFQRWESVWILYVEIFCAQIQLKKSYPHTSNNCQDLSVSQEVL